MKGDAERGGAEKILGLALAAIEKARVSLEEVDIIVVSRGPGSLTGLRVGIGTAQGLAIGGKKPLVGVSTLQAIAAAAPWPGPPVLAILDAGRGEIYAGLFEAGAAPRPRGEETIGSPRSVSESAGDGPMTVIGPAVARYGPLFEAPGRQMLEGDPLLAPAVARIAFALLGGSCGAGQIAEGGLERTVPHRSGGSRSHSSSRPTAGEKEGERLVERSRALSGRGGPLDPSPRYLRRGSAVRQPEP